MLGQNLRKGAEEIALIGLQKERVPFASNVFGRVPKVRFFSTSIGQNSNYIKMTCIDISKHYSKYIYDEMDHFLLQLERAIKKTGTIQTYKTKDGTILILITLQRILQNVQLDGQILVPLTFIVNLKSLITDAKDLTNLIKDGCYNETWLVENAASWLCVTNI